MPRDPDLETRRGARPPVLALRDVALRDGPVLLFDGVDLALEPSGRACLVGRNGAGKSTLLRLLAGAVQPDRGDRVARTGARVALVPQEPEIVGARLIDHVVAGGAPAHAAEAALERFGLDPRRPAEGLSGGEIRRCALARAFAEEPDVLLLDEPTNHLDILAIETLERQVLETRAAVLAVSHDRRFLERISERCFWLADRRIRTLNAGFAAFEAFAEAAEAEEAERLRRLDKAIEREAYAFQRSITGRRTRNERRARLLSEMRAERTRILKDQTRALDFEVDAGGRSGRLVIEAKGVSKSFGGRPLLGGFSTRILRGDRVAVVGPNGAGKTTLVRLLLGEIAPDAGEVRLGARLEVVYLDQSRSQLKPGETLMEALAPGGGDTVLVQGRPVHVAGYAKDFLFQERQLRQPVESLSGGERNRLLLARGLARSANLLVLDEPTNDLDMETLDLLEDRLSDFDGTLLLVSHDRDFVDRLATSTIALDGRGRAVETPGGWTDFVRQNPGFLSPAAPASGRAAARGEGRPAVPAPPPPRTRKLSFNEERRLKACEAEMVELPGTIARLEGELADPALFTRDPEGFQRRVADLDAARAALLKAESDWMSLEEKREALLLEGRPG